MSTFQNISRGTAELLDENGARVYFGVGQIRSGMSNYLFKYTREGGSSQPTLRLIGNLDGAVPAANAYNHNMIGDPVRGKMLTINTADETAGQRRQIDSQFLGMRFTQAETLTELQDEVGTGPDDEGWYLNKTTGDFFIVVDGSAFHYEVTGAQAL